VSGVGPLPSTAVVGAALLFLLQGAFSVALAAIAALNRVALRRMGAEGGGRFSFLEGLRETGSPYRIAAHLARQLCLLGGALLMMLGLWGAGWPYPVAVGSGIGAAFAVVVLEMGLARMAVVWDAKRALRQTVFLLRAARLLLLPLVGPLHLLLVKLGGLQSAAATEEQRVAEQEEEVEALIEVGEREGLLEADEGEMMRSIVDLDETAVREIMTPRPDIIALSLATSVEQARRAVLEAGRSRIPVYRQTLDEIVGVLHVRDLLRAAEEGNVAPTIAGSLREVPFVPETMSVADLLTEMRHKGRMAVVVDEYGGTAGLVTLQDIVEEIVGEIRDEQVSDEADARRETDGTWVVSGAAHVEKLTELFGIEFDERDYDTVGGLVVSELGRLPRPGEALEFGGVRIDVLEVERQRVRLVRVRPVRQPETVRAGP